MKLIYLYLLQALRNMRRHSLQTFLSLAGLVIGLSSFTFGFNWFWYETHYDSFRPDYRNIHLVCNHNQSPERYNFSQPYPMYSLLRDSIPGVTEVAILGNAMVENLTDMNNRPLSKMVDIGVANPGFLKLMGVKLVHGDAKTALDRIDGIVITQRMAQDLFQRENVLGENIKIKEYNAPSRIVTITGVAEDRYLQTSFPFDGLTSLESVPYELRQEWNNYSPCVFFKAVNIQDVDQRLKARLVDGESMFFTVPLSGMRTAEGIWKILGYPACALVVSFLLLISALFNYIAILTAQFIGRFREYKLRVGLGGTFTNNLLWLYSEVFIMCILTILGSGMLLDVISTWSDMTDINTTLFRTFAWLVPVCSMLLFLAALYPAFYLRRSYFQSYEGKTQAKSGKAGMLFMQVLVCSLFLFVFINTYRQFHFLTHSKLGFNHERVIRFRTQGTLFNQQLIESILRELRSREGGCIEEVVAAPSSIFQSSNYGSAYFTYAEGVEPISVPVMEIPAQVFRFFGIQPVHGKIYDKRETGGFRQVMLNKDAADLMHYTLDSKTRLLDNGKPVEVTGIVDFYAFNLRLNKATPVVYFYTDDEVDSFRHEIMFIRYKKGQYFEAMQLIGDVLNKHQVPTEGLDLGKMDAFISNFYKQEAHMLRILSVMFMSSILITLLGILSQISYTLRIHRKFIAVRRVFGATYADLCRVYLHDYILLTCIACIITLPAGYYLITTWLQSYRSSVSVGMFECLWISGMLIVLVSSVILIRLWKALYENPSRVIKGE